MSIGFAPTDASGSAGGPVEGSAGWALSWSSAVVSTVMMSPDSVPTYRRWAVSSTSSVVAPGIGIVATSARESRL